MVIGINENMIQIIMKFIMNFQMVIGRNENMIQTII
jgi:hypothetical protein